MFLKKEISKFKRLVKEGSADDCWVWPLKLNKGYGEVRTETRGKKKSSRAHRIAYFIKWGAFPERSLICHHCDNRACVNPNHLFRGSAVDNAMDMVRKGRQRKSGPQRIKKYELNITKLYCTKGHPRFGMNLVVKKKLGKFRRLCRICVREEKRMAYPAKKRRVKVF